MTDGIVKLECDDLPDGITAELREHLGTWPEITRKRRSVVDTVVTTATFVGLALSTLLIEETAKTVARKGLDLLHRLRPERGVLDVVDESSGIIFVWDRDHEAPAAAAMFPLVHDRPFPPGTRVRWTGAQWRPETTDLRE